MFQRPLLYPELACAEGAEMKIAPAGGGEPVALGRVAGVVLVDL